MSRTFKALLTLVAALIVIGYFEWARGTTFSDQVGQARRFLSTPAANNEAQFLYTRAWDTLFDSAGNPVVPVFSFVPGEGTHRRQILDHLKAEIQEKSEAAGKAKNR